MVELTWFEAVPPRDAALDDVTRMLRVLASRPHQGLRRVQPMVTFETWLCADRVRWLVGVEPQLAGTLPGQLVGQLPQLHLVETPEVTRPTPVTARELRLSSMIYPLRPATAQAVTAGLLQVQGQLRPDEALIIQWVVGPSHVSTRVPVRENPLELVGLATPREPSGEEQRAWKQKLAEPLYGVRGRVGAVTAHPKRAARLLHPAIAALSLASSPHSRLYASPQSSKTASQLHEIMGRLRSWSGIANAAELAAVLGWCLGGLDLPGMGGRFAPPPSALLRDRPPRPATTGRPLGVSTHLAGRARGVWLPPGSYATGSHVIGPPGRGKSTLLAHWALAEASAGGSVVVLEPKGDLVRDISARLPRHGNVVVIDPDDVGGRPAIGFNPLAGPRHAAEQRADSVLALLREVFGSAIGPRSADVLLHALIMAARLEDGTLADVMPLLLNPQFRRRVVTKVGDPLTITPWLAWFDNLSDADRAQVVAPIGNKIRPWTARPVLRHMLGQAAPKFDLAQVFDRPTVLLVNLNAGVLGPETTRLVGSLFLGQLWELIQRQTTVAYRRPVTIIADEWHTFTAGLDFADLVARARGAGVNLVAAHQHLGQLAPGLRSAALANLGTQVVFRPALEDAAPLARVLGQPVTPEDLMGLGPFHAAVKTTVDGAAHPAFEVVTPALPDELRKPETLRDESAERFGTPPAAIDAALLARWQGGNPDAPVGVRRARP